MSMVFLARGTATLGTSTRKADGMTHADYRELAEIDRELMHSLRGEKKKKSAAYQKAYRRQKKGRAAEQKEQEKDGQ